MTAVKWESEQKMQVLTMDIAVQVEVLVRNDNDLC